jgi:hypothetical protein
MDVVLPLKGFRVGPGCSMGPEELQFRVHSMALAIAARISPQ